MKLIFIFNLFLINVNAEQSSGFGRIKEKFDNSTAQMLIYGYGRTPLTHPPKEIENAVHNWVHDVGRDRKRVEFLAWVLDIPNTIPFKASNLIDLDHSPEMSHCAVFVLYSSAEYAEAEFAERLAIENILSGTAEMFYERCAVATVDITYPTNYILFGPFAPTTGTTPALLFKNPVNYNKHVNLLENIRLPEDVRDEENHSFLSLNPNHETWGSLKRFVELKRDLTSEISDLLEKYSSLSKGKTISDALYQPQYRRTAEMDLYKNVTREMHSAYVERIWHKAERSGITYCHSNEHSRCTKDEVLRENDKIEAYMWEELAHFWANADLKEEMNGFVTHTKRPEADRKSIENIRMTPHDPPNTETLFSTWLEHYPPNQGYDEL
jgi:hypothetical protein